MDLKEIISNNLEWWIQKRGYSTIESFSYEHNFQKSALSRVLNRTSLPKLDLVLNLAHALEITADNLLYEPHKKPKGWGEKIFISNRNRSKYQ